MNAYRFNCLFFILFFTLLSVNAADRKIATITPSDKYCQLVFHTAAEDFSPFLLQSEKEYIVVYADDLVPVRGKFSHTFQSEEGITTHRFDLLDGSTMDFANKEIASVMELSNAPQVSQTIVQSSFINKLAVGKGYLSFWLKPFIPLTHRGSIEVVGELTSSRSLAREVASLLEEVDGYLVKFGLSAPEHTRVIINDKPILRDMIGPAAVRTPIYNVWSRERKNLIHLGAWGKNTQVIRSPSVIAHERVHSHFFATYDAPEFINTNEALQEAMADFITAHIFDDPRIGLNVFVEGKALRNIEARSFLKDQKEARFISSIDDISVADFHNDSLLYSNVLWRVRQKIGKDKIGLFVNDIIAILNKHHAEPDLLKLRQLALGKNEKKIFEYLKEQFQNDFNLFMASIQIVADRRGYGSSLKPFLSTLRSELKLDGSQIENYIQIISNYHH